MASVCWNSKLSWEFIYPHTSVSASDNVPADQELATKCLIIYNVAVTQTRLQPGENCLPALNNGSALCEAHRTQYAGFIVYLRSPPETHLCDWSRPQLHQSEVHQSCAYHLRGYHIIAFLLSPSYLTHSHPTSLAFFLTWLMLNIPLVMFGHQN